MGGRFAVATPPLTPLIIIGPGYLLGAFYMHNGTRAGVVSAR